MSESEPLDKNVKLAETALKAEKTQVETEKTQTRERTAVDQQAAQDLREERAAIVKSVNPSLYQRYERVRPNRKGIALAEVVDGRCTACQIVLRLQYFQDLKRGESILSCESCQRILYYNPPQSFEEFEGGTRVAMS
jgi:predicted  nucleic acid-binding Zn-ribbon protein